MCQKKLQGGASYVAIYFLMIGCFVETIASELELKRQRSSSISETRIGLSELSGSEDSEDDRKVTIYISSQEEEESKKYGAGSAEEAIMHDPENPGLMVTERERSDRLDVLIRGVSGIAFTTLGIVEWYKSMDSTYPPEYNSSQIAQYAGVSVISAILAAGTAGCSYFHSIEDADPYLGTKYYLARTWSMFSGQFMAKTFTVVFPQYAMPIALTGGTVNVCFGLNSLANSCKKRLRFRGQE